MRFATIRRTVVVGIVGVVILGGSMMVGAAGPGRFLVTLIGAGAQQGGATVTGTCQNGAPITLEYATDYVAGAFVVDGITITGIEAACEGGSLVVNGDGSMRPFTAVDGAADVTFSTPYDLGEIEELDVLLIAPND